MFCTAHLVSVASLHSSRPLISRPHVHLFADLSGAAGSRYNASQHETTSEIYKLSEMLEVGA